MENEFFTNESSVLYQNRFCHQENFDVIINSGNAVGEKRIHKLKSPNFTSFDTLVSKSAYIEESLTSGSSIWVTCCQETKKKNIDDFN